MSFNVLDDRVFKYFVHKLCGLVSIERTHTRSKKWKDAKKERNSEGKREIEAEGKKQIDRKTERQTGKKKGQPPF